MGGRAPTIDDKRTCETWLRISRSPSLLKIEDPIPACSPVTLRAVSVGTSKQITWPPGGQGFHLQRFAL